MWKAIVTWAPVLTLLAAPAVPLLGQTKPAAAQQKAAKLIAVLKSDAPHKDKADACRQLAVLGSAEAVPALAALLGDEKLAHMARYGLEPIPEPAVDDAFRVALGKLKGRLLVGVIGSIGVRRDAKAVTALAKVLGDPDAEVARAAARSLGRIGTTDAAKALQSALADAAAANQPALCEGLFRCAETLADNKQRKEAVAIYDRMRSLKAPPQVRAGALRGAILTRGKEGLPLLRQHLRGKDDVLFTAAVRTAQELPGAEVVDVLTAELKELPADRQIVVIQTLGKRADEGAVPVLLATAKADLPAGLRVALCGQAASLVKKTEDKKQLLVALGSIPSADAFDLIVPFLDQAAIKDDASVALVSVAERLLKGPQAAQVAAGLIGPLQRVARSSANAELGKRARAALQQAESKAAKK